jgi:hypothetical protein
MNAFEQHINNNEQQLIDDLFTIKKSLLDIFALNPCQYASMDADRFNLKINGMDNLYGRIRNGKIQFGANGLDKFQIKFDDEKSVENVKKNLIPKMKLPCKSFTIGQYSQMKISIEFDRLTNDVIHDIMLLSNATKAKLRPKNIRIF